MNQSLKNDSQKKKCIFCNYIFANTSNLYRHIKNCKMKKEGIFVIWNKNMVCDNEKFYKIGQSTKRIEKINQNIFEYSITKNDIDFLHEVFLKNEVFAEKILKILLQNYKIDEDDNFKIPIDILKNYINNLAELLNEEGESQGAKMCKSCRSRQELSKE